MRLITFISLLTLTACSTSTEQTSEITTADTSSKNAPQTNADALRTSGERKYYDSAHFTIVRGKYISGAKFIDVYENKQTGLDSWTEYYENGQLKEEGLMTNSNHIYVGNWNYYSSTGKLDSAVNYDEKYNISYFDAVEILTKAGYKDQLADISLTTEDNITYWEITLSTKKVDKFQDAISINASTGKLKFEKDKFSIVH